ncbi:MAG: tetratricopeptide repeat protein [Phycisphaerales bacterium]|nr:tetratricopeptide repeat protein [Phycisphaerales bacterium]
MSTKKSRKGRKSKKRQVNKRLLSIIGLSAVILFGIGAGLVYLQIQSGVSRNLAAGDARVEEGKYLSALKHYGRALKHEPGNAEAHQKRVNAYRVYIPESRERAAELYPEYLHALGQRANLVPSNDVAFEEAMEEWHQAAWNTGQSQLWAGLERQTEILSRHRAEGTPLGNRLLFLNGVAKMRMGENDFLGDVDETGHVRFPGEAELTRYVELEPNSDEGMAHLAFGRMAVARRLGLQGNTRQESINLEMAQETYDRAIDSNPEGVATLLAVIRHLYIHELLADARGREDIESALVQLNDRLEQAEAIVQGQLSSISRHHVLDLLQFLEMIDLDNGDERSQAIMQAWLEIHPRDFDMMVRLASTSREVGDLEESAKWAQEVLDGETLPVSMNSFLQAASRVRAANEILEVLIDRRSEADSAELAAASSEARDVLVGLLDGDQEHPLILVADGRIAYQNGEYSKTVRALEEAIRRTNTLPAEIYRIAADSLEQIGQPGLAAERLKQAIAAAPRLSQNRLLLASLYVRMRDYEEALVILEAIPSSVRESNPDVARVEESVRVALESSGGQAPQPDEIRDPILKAIAQADLLDREGQISAALDLLQSFALEHPDDVRLLSALALTQAKLDRIEEALVTLNHALSLSPDSDLLKNVKLTLENPDPVSRVSAMVESRNLSDDDKLVTIYAGLIVLAESRELMAAEQTSDPKSAAENLEIVARARAAAEEMSADVMALSKSNTGAFAIVFEDLLKEQKFDEAEMLVEFARESDVDQAGGNLAEARWYLRQAEVAEFEGRSEQAQGLYESAATAARRATEEAPWRNQTWITLGRSMRGAGDLEEAKIALDTAVRRDPSDLESLRQLTAMHLMQGGDPSRAVILLAEASARAPQDMDLRNQWLQIEAAYGSKQKALAERKRDWLASPDDPAASMWYAGLLASYEPEFSLMLDSVGRPRFTGREWLALDSRRQAELLNTLKLEWLDAIEQIVDALGDEDDPTMLRALQHATLLREVGRREEMLPRLTRFLDANQSDDEFVPNVLRAASLLSNSDRGWDAKKILLKYRESQNPKLLDIDTQLAFALHESGECDEALPYLRGVAEKIGDLDARLRIVDCLLQLRQLDEAESLLQDLEEENPDNYQVANLTAGVALQRGQQAEAQGNAEGVATAAKNYREALDRASQIEPTRAAPYAAMIQSLIREHARTLNRALLEEALRYADAGMEVASQDPDLVTSRAEVLVAMGEPRRAVLDLEAFLRRQPGNRDVRRALVNTHQAAGAPTRAINTIRSAIAQSPRDPYWHGLLGDFLVNYPESIKDATTAYISAWDLEPTRRRLMALTNATLTTREWDYEAAMAAIANHRAEFPESGRLIGLRARAESGLGLASRSRESLREARAAYDQSIAADAEFPVTLISWYEDLYALYPSGSDSDAVAIVEEVTAGNKTKWDHRGLARFYGLRGQPEDLTLAIQYQNEAIAKANDKQLIIDLQYLGSLHLRNDDAPAAADAFFRLVELSPNDPTALNNYAYLLATTMQKPEEAEVYAAQAVQLSPRNPSFVDTMATIHELTGRYEKAAIARQTLLGLNPNDIESMLNLAELMTDRLDRAKDAMPYMEKAISLQPRDSRVLDTAGWTAWNAGLQAQGKDQVSQSIRQQPSASGHLHMARILVAEGRFDEARDHLLQADHLASDQPMQQQIEEVRKSLDAGR